MINITYTVAKVFTLPSLRGMSDVVKRVIYNIVFEDSDHPGITSSGAVDCVLNTDDLTPGNMIPFAAMTRTNFLEKAQAANPPAAILAQPGFQEFHASRLAFLASIDGVVEQDISGKQ